MAEKIKLTPRVRYDDDEIGRVGREREVYRHDRRLSRQSSVGSLSIHSAGGGTRTVEPGAALPITYRTLSIEVDEGLQSKQEAVKKAKEKGGVGKRKQFHMTAQLLMIYVWQISPV
jgi:sodium/potassium-transporting ATPase subunit alpha